MKKIFTLLALLVATVVTVQATDAVQIRRTAKALKEGVELKSGLNAPSNKKAVQKDFPTGAYKSLGMGYMTDDMICPLYSLSPVTYQVEIQQSENDPNFYRVIAPYGKNFATEVNKQLSTPLSESEYDVEGNCHIDIDATNPDDVYFAKTMTGCDWGNGELFIGISTSGTVTLKDGKFTASLNGLAIGFGDGAYASNKNGKFRITLPGAKLDDYTIALTPETQCLTTHDFKCNLNVGNDVAVVKYAVIQNMQEDEMVKTVNKIAETDNVFRIRGDFSYKMAEETNKETLIVVALNSENAIVGYDWVTYYFVNQSDEDWENVGTATLKDAALITLYKLDSEELTCEMQRNTLRPTYYRLVNPFKNSKYASERYYHSSHNHYIYINADNADCIFLEESPIGFDFGQGLVRYTSSARYYLDAGFELEECIELGLGAEYSDGKLSFGDEAILVSALGYDNGDWYITDAGTEIVLPDGVDLSGVESVIDDNNENAKVELYNLQGIRITNPQEGQFYIKRQGNKVSKLIF